MQPELDQHSLHCSTAWDLRTRPVIFVVQAETQFVTGSLPPPPIDNTPSQTYIKQNGYIDKFCESMQNVISPSHWCIDLFTQGIHQTSWQFRTSWRQNQHLGRFIGKPNSSHRSDFGLFLTPPNTEIARKKHVVGRKPHFQSHFFKLATPLTSSEKTQHGDGVLCPSHMSHPLSKLSTLGPPHKCEWPNQPKSFHTTCHCM